jgi:hypothetical protein
MKNKEKLFFMITLEVVRALAKINIKQNIFFTICSVLLVLTRLVFFPYYVFYQKVFNGNVGDRYL